MISFRLRFMQNIEQIKCFYKFREFEEKTLYQLVLILKTKKWKTFIKYNV